MTIGVVVVDGHGALRGLLAAYLDDDPAIDVVGQASDTAGAMQQVLQTRPDVVLVNMLVPELMDGADVVSTLRRRAPEVEIVVVTTVLTKESLAAAVRADAIGYVLRDMSAGAIRAQVKAAAKRQIGIPGLMVEHVTGATPADPKDPLTAREQEILCFLAGGEPNKSIAHRLGISERTVKSHVSAVLAKLGVESRVQAAIYAYSRGLVGAQHPGAEESTGANGG